MNNNNMYTKNFFLNNCLRVLCLIKNISPLPSRWFPVKRITYKLNFNSCASIGTQNINIPII